MFYTGPNREQILRDRGHLKKEPRWGLAVALMYLFGSLLTSGGFVLFCQSKHNLHDQPYTISIIMIACGIPLFVIATLICCFCGKTRKLTRQIPNKALYVSSDAQIEQIDDRNSDALHLVSTEESQTASQDSPKPSSSQQANSPDLDPEAISVFPDRGTNSCSRTKSKSSPKRSHLPKTSNPELRKSSSSKLRPKPCFGESSSFATSSQNDTQNYAANSRSRNTTVVLPAASVSDKNKTKVSQQQDKVVPAMEASNLFSPSTDVRQCAMAPPPYEEQWQVPTFSLLRGQEEFRTITPPPGYEDIN